MRSLKKILFLFVILNFSFASANSSASGMSSELFDHYEEGTFDITIAMEAAGSWNKLKALVRPWEKEILVNIKKEFDAQKKPSARPRGESYVDGKYYIVRYYKWMKSRNDGTDMYVNTLNIRKGDKVLFKVGYVINTNLTLNPEDKIKFDKEADWRS